MRSEPVELEVVNPEACWTTGTWDGGAVPRAYVYPNPAPDGRIQLVLEHHTEPLSIRIYDQQGRLIDQCLDWRPSGTKFDNIDFTIAVRGLVWIQLGGASGVEVVPVLLP